MLKAFRLLSSSILCAYALFLLFSEKALSEIPDGLRLGKDNQGEYASYVLQKGETVWGSVILKYVRPSMRTNKAAGEILKRSGITDATKLHEGIEIKIPLEYLVEKIKPAELVKIKPLKGVVVILDPGHGGIDTGAIGRGSVYEDEINYDIAVRLKNKLEEKTSAEVFLTIRDRSRGYAENHSEAFPSDQDEFILTTPLYYIKESKLGVHLRWYLANSLYRRKIRAGINPGKVVFISIHTDALGSQSRGSTVYYPGRNYCKDGFKAPNSTYKRYQEVKEMPNVSYGYSDRAKSESSSMKFAQTIVNSLRAKKITVFNNRPIRDHITRGSSFVPAVLKYNAILVKVLIETANLENKYDLAKIKNAGFRDLYADALLDALMKFYSK